MLSILNRNVVVLMLCQILAFSASFSLMFVGGLIGTELSGSERLGTLPIAAMIIGTALGVAPVIMAMKPLGRKTVFVLAGIVGLLAVACIVLALQQQSFVLFCIGSAVLGVFLASVQQYRFAAMESVSLDQAPTAASMLLLAGVVAAFVGPELVLWGKSLTAVAYQGSYLIIGGCLVIALCIMCFYRNSAPVQIAQASAEGRPLSALLKLPPLWLALLSAGIGYAVMSLVMTATPVSMHNHFAHSLEDTKWVLQSHVTAMFLPSLIAPLIVARIGIHGLMTVGLVAMFGAIIVSALNITVDGFWLALVLLGIGWNFMFVSGTSLLPTIYRDGEHFGVQAVNDGLVFSIQAIATFSSGWVLATWQWQGLLLAALPLLAIQVLLLLWVRFISR